jgi:hypothetical protein
MPSVSSTNPRLEIRSMHAKSGCPRRIGGRCGRRDGRAVPLTCGVVVVELRGFEPLTPCMPSRDPDRSGPTKPRITRHATEPVVVTRGVSRGLLRLQLLPRCCPAAARPTIMNMRRRPGQGGGGLYRESESGVFLTLAELPLRQRGETDPNLTTGNLHVFMCPSRSPQRAAACRTCVGAAGAAAAGDRSGIT